MKTLKLCRLISERKIRSTVKRMAKQIYSDYSGEDLLFVGVLKGSFMFLADLIRFIPSHAQVDFVIVSCYGSKTFSSGKIKLIADLRQDVRGKNVIIVEDIIDTGRTINLLQKLFNKRGAKSVKICALLDKPSRREVKLKIDYKGLTVPDKFVVGYGLDYSEQYRNLPYVGYLGVAS